jgi:hypothetical protein
MAACSTPGTRAVVAAAAVAVCILEALPREHEEAAPVHHLGCSGLRLVGPWAWHRFPGDYLVG